MCSSVVSCPGVIIRHDVVYCLIDVICLMMPYASEREYKDLKKDYSERRRCEECSECKDELNESDPFFLFSLKQRTFE
jgi:hypothetical protein